MLDDRSVAYSTIGQRKIIDSKVPTGIRDMLVSRRVNLRFFGGPSCQRIAFKLVFSTSDICIGAFGR